MKRFQRFLGEYRPEIIIFSAITFVYFFNVWSLPIIDGDTFFYIAKAKRLLGTENWFIFENLSAKPPLILWLSALFYKIMGANLFSVNLWHTMFSLGTIFMTYLFGRRFFYRKAALYSAVILASSLLMFYQDRTPMLDTPLAFFCTVSVFFIMLFEEQQKYRDIILAFFFAGLAFLTKGLLGLAIPFGAYFFYLLFIREFWRRVWSHLPKFLAGFVVFLLVISIWILPQMLYHGQQFANEMFRENIERFFHTIDSSGTGMVHQEGSVQRDYYVYIIYLAIFFLPWSVFIIPAIRKSGSMTGMLRSVFWFVFIVFSVSGHYKNPRYILPLYPALSLLVGYYLSDNPKIGKLARVVYWVFGGLFTIAAVYLLMAELPADSAAYLPIALTLLVGLSVVTFTAAITAGKDSDLFFKMTSSTMFLTLLAFVFSAGIVLPRLDQATILSRETSKLTTDHQIIAVDRKLYDLQFYLNQPVLNVESSNLSAKLKNLPGGNYLILSNEAISQNNIKILKSIPGQGYIYSFAK